MVTWPADPLFGSVLEAASLWENPFQALPETVTIEDVADADAMPQNLRRTFHCSEACFGRHLVLVWALAKPYTHTDGFQRPSTIVYIEKTVGSIRGRWPMRYLKYLASGGAALLPSNLALRDLAAQDHNYAFYSTVISAYGPLSVWFASAENIDAASGLALRDSREWERRFLRSYYEVHGCFPLKNRRS